MTMQRLIASAQDLGEREVGVIAATNELARDGHVLEPSGINLANYRKNPIVLFGHDIEQPIAACTAIAVENGSLAGRIQFAPPGVSARADEICGLTKAGILSGISIGFDILEAEPLDPAKGTRGGLHITQSELLEISVVSVPADTGAGIVARSFTARPGATAMLRSLRPLAPHVIARTFARITAGPRVPLIQIGPQGAAELDRAHTRVAFAGVAAREAERRERISYEQRQLDLKQLSGATEH